MSVNVKLGNDVIEGVETVQLENADTPGEYVQFGTITPSQKKIISLSLADGDQTVEPDEGHLLSEVKITKPATLVAENIKKDINVAGVVGTLETGSHVPGGHTLTFYSEDDSMYAIHQVPSGSQVAAPVSPTKQNYNFVGWSTVKSDLSTVLNFPYMIADDTSAWAAFAQSMDLEVVSWSTVRAVSDAGTASSFWSVGDLKSITIPSGTEIGSVTFSADTTLCTYILGFDHNLSVEAYGYNHSITFGTFKTMNPGSVDIALVDSKYGTQVSSGTYFSMNNGGSNSGGWKNCRMRNIILGSTDMVNADATSATPLNPASGTVMAALPASLRQVMKPIIKWTDNAGGGSDTASNVTPLIDYLPLMSEFELYGSRNHANSTEQDHQLRYQYYVDGNAALKYKYNATGTKSNWWLRSPFVGQTHSFCAVVSDGYQYYPYAYNSWGCTPIFAV